MHLDTYHHAFGHLSVITMHWDNYQNAFGQLPSCIWTAIIMHLTPSKKQYPKFLMPTYIKIAIPKDSLWILTIFTDFQASTSYKTKVWGKNLVGGMEKASGMSYLLLAVIYCRKCCSMDINGRVNGRVFSAQCAWKSS